MLIAIGVTAAFLISIYNTLFTNGPVYYETAVGILVIVTGGRYLEARARSKATAATNLLESQLPEIAYVILPDGSFAGNALASFLCDAGKKNAQSCCCTHFFIGTFKHNWCHRLHNNIADLRHCR